MATKASINGEMLVVLIPLLKAEKRSPSMNLIATTPGFEDTELKHQGKVIRISAMVGYKRGAEGEANPNAPVKARVVQQGDSRYLQLAVPVLKAEKKSPKMRLVASTGGFCDIWIDDPKYQKLPLQVNLNAGCPKT